MKNIFIIVLTSITLNLNANYTSFDDCISNLSIFAEYAKVKNYDSAYDPWVAVKNEC